MIRETTRREFLTRSAAGTLILGLQACFDGKSRGRQPKFMKETLARVRSVRRPGVVIRIPNDPVERESLGKAVITYVDGKDPETDRGAMALHGSLPDPTTIDLDLHEIFLEAVFVCLEDGEIERWIAGAQADDTLLLIDEEGRRIDGARASTRSLASPAAFLRESRALLHGPRESRLRERAAAVGRGVAGPDSAALDRYLASSSVPVEFKAQFPRLSRAMQEAACQLHYHPEIEKTNPLVRGRLLSFAEPTLSNKEILAILRAAEPMVPALVLQRLDEGAAPRAWRLRALLETLFQLAAESDDFHALPFGVGVDGVRDYTDACGSTASSKEPGPFCGMGYSGPIARRFVGFLAD